VLADMMPRGSQLDAILKGFPGPVRLTPSRRTWALVLLGCIGFTAISAAMIRDGDIRGWLVGLFILGIPVAAVMLLPGAGGLVLDGEGFDVISMYRTHRSRWIDTGSFMVATLPSGQKMVVYDSRTPGSRVLAQLNTGIAGRNSGLPDTYGLKPEALAELMTCWREQALRSHAM
jgi:hypothetical protein